jgi:hypothetical protein
MEYPQCFIAIAYERTVLNARYGEDVFPGTPGMHHPRIDRILRSSL